MSTVARSRTWLALGMTTLVALSGCAASDSQGGGEGGTALVALTQEPGVFNPMFSVQTGSTRISEAFVVEPLYLTLADGSYEPFLADEIPTVENGGVSEDGLEITFTIREGITWSDGEEFTADDLAFTVGVAQDEASAARPEPEYAMIESTEVVDDTTLVATLSQPTPSYLELFKHVLPEHQFESTAIALEDPAVRLALGTGPFVFDEWESGSQLTMVANDDYWREDAQPELDSVIVSMVPEAQNAIGGFIDGDYDTLAFFTSGDMTQVADAEEAGAAITVESPDVIGAVEWLWLNHSDGGDMGTPHPVLGDLAVRQAIDLAIDRQAIIDDVLGGFGSTTSSFIYAGLGAVESEGQEFDPDAAGEILDEAGWVLGDDGVRVRDGVRASITFQTIAGDQVRSLYQQMIQQNLADIGIETQIENVESNALFDTEAAGGLLATGDFDMVMSRDGFFSDPAVWIELFTTETTIGFSYSHRSDPEYDALAEASASAIDVDERIDLIQQIDARFTEQLVAIPLYASGVYYPFSTALEGVSVDEYWEGPWTTAGTVDWTLAD